MSKHIASDRAAAPRRIACFEAGYDSWYGAQRSLATLIQALPAERAEAIIVTTAPGALATGAAAQGIPVHVLAGGAGVSVSGMTRSRPGPLRLAALLLGLCRVNLASLRWVRQQKIDVLYANNARALTYFLLPALLLRLPVIWYVRIDQRLRGLFPLALRVADKVICITAAVGERAFTAQERRDYARRFEVLWTGFPLPPSDQGDALRTAVRGELGLGPGQRLLLAVGSVSERKGHDVLVDAFLQLAPARPELCLAIAGDPAAEAQGFLAQLQARIGDAGLAGRVFWLGYRSDVPALYAAADLVVLPSKAEGLPRVVPEALSMGRAIVASDAGGTRELLQDPGFGSVVHPLTPEGIAAAVEHHLADPALNDAPHAARRRRFVAERLSVAAYRDGFLGLLDEL
ncbi:MAG TPA: glycosyltransferase [Solimonas sp.]|nr:glycosyltransferase [Solimonas sp.]